MGDVVVERDGPVLIVTIDRPDVRNAVDGATAEALVAAFVDFDGDTGMSVAVLTGAGGTFCSGADLRAVASGQGAPRVSPEGDGPMGPSRMMLGKPVVAAVEGYAVAGGLELALWCDLRVAAETAVFGVHCRRWGVPLVDGGTIRLPRLIGFGRALDMILTGRSVCADEARAIGLVDRLVPHGQALAEAVALAQRLSRLPQGCLRSDRTSVYEQWGRPLDAALQGEFALGLEVIRSGETAAGAARFAAGEGRHGQAAASKPDEPVAGVPG